MVFFYGLRCVCSVFLERIETFLLFLTFPYFWTECEGFEAQSTITL